MQLRTLQWRRVARVALSVLMMSCVGIAAANPYTEDHKILASERAIYDFSQVCSTGQILYYKITNSTLHYVSVGPKFTTPTEPYGSTPPVGPISIPETVEHNGITYTVTAIADNTFSNCDLLTGDLVIPNTVTSIGASAFYLCSGFNGTITLGNALTTIGVHAFDGCSNLHGNLVIPDGITSISAGIFYNCVNLTGTLTLPNNVTYIGSNAFENCGFTGQLYLPNTVETIANYAFKNCSGFTGDLIIPNSVTTLRYGVFQNCSGFNGDLVIPNSFPKFYSDAFSLCSNIRAIYIYNVTSPNFSSDASIDNVFWGISSSTPLYVPNPSNYSAWTRFPNKYQRNFFIRGIDSDWNNPNNWVSGIGGDVVIVADCEMNNLSAEINTLTIISRYNLSIKSGNIMTVNSTITNRGTTANLIIEDGAQFMHNQNGVLATMKKNINAYNSNNNGWHLISTPLAGNNDITAVENMLSNSYDLYYYDEPTYYWINQEQADNEFTELESGKGYLYANSENVTLGFAGALKNGAEPVTISQLSYQADCYLKGFNLVGNPYAHNVTSIATVNVAEQGCYRMNGTADDLMVSEVSSADPLKPAEGIFVLATNENASVTFNTAKTRTETEKTRSICLEILENGKVSDRLLVKRNEGNDFQKLSLRDNRTKLFATRDNEELAIVVCNNDEQSVNFKTAKNGTYTISVTLKDVEVDYLHLIDNLTGDDVDLLANSTYSFEAKTDDYTSRFRLVFSPEATENGNNDSFAYIANNEFIIANDGMATLQVVDLTGRILSTETIHGSFNMPINLSSGVYMLRLINDNNVRTQKIVVE